LLYICVQRRRRRRLGGGLGALLSGARRLRPADLTRRLAEDHHSRPDCAGPPTSIRSPGDPGGDGNAWWRPATG